MLMFRSNQFQNLKMLIRKNFTAWLMSFKSELLYWNQCAFRLYRRMKMPVSRMLRMKKITPLGLSITFSSKRKITQRTVSKRP